MGRNLEEIAMLLKDRVILITNVEKFAGHGHDNAWLWARAPRFLAHDPSFEAPSGPPQVRKPSSRARTALAATEPATLVELGAESVTDTSTRWSTTTPIRRCARAAKRSAAGRLPRPRWKPWRWCRLRLVQLVVPSMRKRKFGPHRVSCRRRRRCAAFAKLCALRPPRRRPPPTAWSLRSPRSWGVTASR